MTKKYNDDWYHIIKRLNEMSNITPEDERQQLLEAASHEPRILDDRDVTLADIAKLAGIKEYVEPVKVSKKAEQLIESIVSEEKVTEQSAITKIIEASDKNKESMGKKMEQEGQKLSKRLEQIAELEEKIAELKTQEIEENTYEPEKFKGKLRELLEYFLKNASIDQMVDMYKMIADENIKVSEDGRVTIGELVTEIQEDDKEASGFTDKQIRMAFGVLNDPKYKGGNYDGAVEVINKIAPELADHPSVANALKRANEDTNEAHGHEGQSEYRAHTIRLAGDFDQENPVSDSDAEVVKQAIIKNSAEQEGRGIVMDVEPAEGAYDSVVVHTMRDREDVLKYLGDMVDESTETPYTDELSQ
jgi:Asp-tRNA(Asn)/Glu-tRNA(Gln) amidotransferase C subunit